MVRNICESILDVGKYQPLHQIMKKMAQSNLTEGFKVREKKVTGKTKRVAKMKCKKCNSSSSVRFLTSQSKTTLNSDGTGADQNENQTNRQKNQNQDYWSSELCSSLKTASVAVHNGTAATRSIEFTEHSLPRLNSIPFHSKPESTPCPYSDTGTTHSLTDRPSSKSSPIKVKSRSQKSLNQSRYGQQRCKSQQQHTTDHIPVSTEQDHQVGGFGKRLFKDLQYQEQPSRPFNPRLKHR
ncbi:uncharacterized protein LOC142355752, partial [Convolutriloba macropyga]|uniref:uncharacterized protein LOC142355752 n=1 Tax=Convolutriloba macropyga TaxID=536237 RepID=UPI003F52720B